MNELQQQYGDKGLSVIGVTDEAKSDTEKFISSKGVKYAYAYDKGGKLSRYFGVSGIPHAVLIDAGGTVIWSGHPGTLDEKTIEAALVGALKKPAYEWSKAAAPVKQALATRDYAKALAAAKKLSAADGGAEIADSIQGIVASKMAALRKAVEEGDALAAQTMATSLNASLAGLPEQAEVAKVLADLKSDPKTPKIIEALKTLEAIDLNDLKKRKDADKLQADLERIIKDFPDLLPAKRAKLKLDRLAQIKPGLK